MRSTIGILLCSLFASSSSASLVQRYSLVDCEDVGTTLAKGLARDKAWDCNVVDGTRSRLSLSAKLPPTMMTTIDSKGMSIAIWTTISPLVELATQRLMSIASPDGPADCPLFEISFDGTDNQIMVQFIDRFGVCRNVAVNTIQSPGAVLVISFGVKSMSVFLNGGSAQLANAPQTMHAELWKRAKALQFFPGKSNIALKQRIPVQQMELYDHPLGGVQAQELWNQGAIYPIDGRLQLPSGPADELLVQTNTSQTATITHVLPDNTLTFPTSIEILSTPDIGQVRVESKKAALKKGMILPWTREVSFDYNVPPDYFNVPIRNARGLDLQHEKDITLSYRLIVRTRGVVAATSDPVSIPFRIVHVNHPPELVAPSQISVPKSTGVALIEGITVLDSLDSNMDRVRVEVSVSIGTLTLPPGNPSQTVEIVAVPDDVAWMLHGMRYNGAGKDGVMKVAVYDGAGAPCLELEDHDAFSREMGNEYTTEHNGECFSRFETVPIVFVEQQGSDARVWRVLMWVLPLVLVATFACCTWFVFHCWLSKRINSEKMIVDDNGQEPNVEDM